MNIKRQMEHAANMKDGVQLQLTGNEAEALKGLLERLMHEVNHGVDVWLAPGGVLDVNSADTSAEVFLDYDSPAVDELNSIIAKL